MLRDASWLFDREQERADNAALAAYDRREEIEKAVDFSDLLEECCEFTLAQRELFMTALAHGNNSDVHAIYCLLDQAKEQIVKRRLAGGV
ncbi:hypothetical protein [Paraburkholderia sp. BL9I2N2]|uniref:hypothetical protein n=1 Tax=Paraburkholderia sp. BL9I2N2 TaxID=1938809 RepID=UPI00104CDB3A|nr:hypothetical protein [Paraburkholderia sp. BL9I2N2]